MLAVTPIMTVAVTPVSLPAPVPVLLRHDPDMDACPSVVRARLPRGGPDGFLSLRAGPGVALPEVARLRPDASMFECGRDGEWAAVIVRPRGGGDCAIPVPSGAPIRYRGPFRHGWVARRLIETIAG